MPGEDRRVRRTRRALRDAMVSLVLERGYANVTVEDITARADLGRATFYTHFTDKDDLLDKVVADLAAELEQRLRPLVPVSSAGFTGEPVLELFRHAAEERDAYRVVLRGEGDGRALRRFVDDRSAAAAKIFAARAAAHDTVPTIDIEVLARAWVGEQVAVMQWWLESDPPALSVEEVTEMLRGLSLYGRYWATGFETGGPDDAPGANSH